MGRPRGRRSHDYEEKRAALAHRVFECVLADASTSLNAMAEHAGVSRPTLRHYFGDRDGAVRAALEAATLVGAPHLEALRALPVDDPRGTLEEALQRLVIGWRAGVGKVHAVGIKVGLDDRETGRTYVVRILEPLLQGLEHLLTDMVAAGTLAPVDARYGALSLASPIVLALLHQDALGGADCRPLDVDRLPAVVAADFCRLHRPDGSGA